MGLIEQIRPSGLEALVSELPSQQKSQNLPKLPSLVLSSLPNVADLQLALFGDFTGFSVTERNVEA